VPGNVQKGDDPMTDRKVRQTVAQAIAETHPIWEKYYHLCWWKGKLQCFHVHHTKDIHTVFYSAPGQVFIDGLTPHQWELVTTRIIDFCRSHAVTLGGTTRYKAGTSQARLQITEFDSKRLRALLATAGSWASSANACLDKLQQLLEAADTVSPEEVPNDVVTMNSQVCLRDDDGASEMTVSLVFPLDAVGDADFEKMKVSILTPIGVSILGRRIGDTVEGHLKVQRLPYQPEAAGDFHL